MDGVSELKKHLRLGRQDIQRAWTLRSPRHPEGLEERHGRGYDMASIFEDIWDRNGHDMVGDTTRSKTRQAGSRRP